MIKLKLLLPLIIAFVTLSTNAQMSLIRGVTDHLEVVKFIVTNDPAAPNTEDRLIKFIGDCPDCPDNLKAKASTSIYYPSTTPSTANIESLRLNTSYDADSISYNKETLVTYEIFMDQK
jgi:hypothetical protein